MLIQKPSTHRFLSVLGVNLLYLFKVVTSGENVLDEIGFCGDCYCIPSSGQSCPGMASLPQVEFAEDFLTVLRTITPNNSFSLACNPYQSDDCDTEPPLETGGACVIEVLPPQTSTTCPDQYLYRLVTVESREAVKENQLLTHEGPCGLCSSLQDLSIYMTSPNVTSLDSICTSRILVDFNDGVTCYVEAGFSEPCASIRAYKMLQTSRLCGDFCDERNIGTSVYSERPPTCELDDCLLCDELISWKKFKRFAGRTWRNSGLLSGQVRNCIEIAAIVHQNPCSPSGVEISSSRCQHRLDFCSQHSDCCSGRCQNGRCRLSKLRHGMISHQLSTGHRGTSNRFSGMEENSSSLP